VLTSAPVNICILLLVDCYWNDDARYVCMYVCPKIYIRRALSKKKSQSRRMYANVCSINITSKPRGQTDVCQATGYPTYMYGTHWRWRNKLSIL